MAPVFCCTGRTFVAEQTGYVYIYDADWIRNPVPFIDISETVEVQPGYDERGFLCMAFHPNFQGTLALTYIQGEDLVSCHLESTCSPVYIRFSTFQFDRNPPIQLRAQNT